MDKTGCAGIVLAGGAGSRAGGEVPKQYQMIGERMVVTAVLLRLMKHPRIGLVQIVAGREWRERILKELEEGLRAAPDSASGKKDDERKVIRFSDPGDTRQGSILNALRDLKDVTGDRDVVLIHDAARPFVSEETITACLAACGEHDGAMPVLPMKDTVYYSAGGVSAEKLLERDHIYAGQAPEAFLFGKYLAANETLSDEDFAAIRGSSEPALLAGMDIALLPGDEGNFKLTTPEDMERCRRMSEQENPHPVLSAMGKPSRNVIGLMSGTSADGVDAALCRIYGHGTETRVEQRAFVSVPFSEEVRREILRLAGGESASAADFCRMNFLMGELFAEAALEVCRAGGIAPSEIDLIGSHGHTFWHQPVEEEYLGRRIRSTLQLGESAVLAERFSCPVISDFRVRDVAAGGLGAPLVPYTEFLIYRSSTECVALQNIGGIGNITCLPPDCGMDEVLAFDTGPGNMLIDAAISRITRGTLRYDDNGAMAGAGQVDERLLARLMEDGYLYRKPPKTTGREYYGAAFTERIFALAEELQVNCGEDVLATVTAYTAQTIAYSVRHYLPMLPERLVIGGGGSRNRTLLQDLSKALPECRVVTNEELGYDSDAKEAVAFAVLANEALFSGCNNVPSVTGAAHPVVMGKLSVG